MKYRMQTLLKISFLILVVFSVQDLSAQECEKKLNEWNKKNTFPAGVVDDYADCVDKAEKGLTEIETEIRKLQVLRNTQISTLEASFDKLSEYYLDEEQDDMSDKFKARKKALVKKHKKVRL